MEIKFYFNKNLSNKYIINPVMSGQDRCIDSGFGNMTAIHITPCPTNSAPLIREGSHKLYNLPSLVTPGCAESEL